MMKRIVTVALAAGMLWAAGAGAASAAEGTSVKAQAQMSEQGAVVTVTATVSGRVPVLVKVKDCEACAVRVTVVKKSGVQVSAVPAGGAWLVTVKGSPFPARWEQVTAPAVLPFP